MKKILSVVLLLSLVVLAGCGGGQPASNQTQEEADTKTTASIVNEEAAFLDAIGEDGKWIIATLNDLTFDQELVVEGTFHDKGNSDNKVYRKIAPYTQDEDYNVTERFTITAPKMTIKSPNAKFQAGTFEGDIYVQAKGFTLEDATVEGNVYFASEKYHSSATITDNSEVTGNVEVKADTVSAASIVEKEAVFKKAIAEDGKWIIATLNDLSFDEELVIEGTFHDKGNSDNKVYRKIAPYTQDEDYNVTERFTITAPKMTIKSPNTKFQAGIFEGDIYVQAKGFTLEDATVEGNVYFASEEYKSSATITDNSEVTGNVEVKSQADTVSAASIVEQEAVFKKAIAKDGKWIICTLNDLTFNEELVVEGTFHDKGNSDNKVYRKIAPYTQDEDYNVTERFTITAPKMTIKSPNAKFQAGIFEGDIYVQAKGFTLEDATVKGNVYFTTEEYQSSATITDNSEVTGNVEVK